MKRTILAVCLFSAVNLVAQEAFDALRYSQSEVNGTARSIGMANAFGALGGDLTALGINPAGIAVYRSSEISFSPVVSIANLNSDFKGSESSDSKVGFGVNNFGVVGSYRTYDDSKIANYNFGVTYNRLKSFNRNVNVIGLNRPVSLLDNLSPYSTLENMAYETYLLDENYNPVLQEGELLDNEQYAIEKGSIGEWNFSMGFNYNHFLYFGASLGVQSVNYELDTYYKEFFDEGGSLELVNWLNTSGTGINGKIGLILRPIPELRLGFSYHTPTYYSLRDDYDAHMSSYGMPDENGDIEDRTIYISENEPDPVYYQLETPQLFVISAAAQMGQVGLLSVDYEIIDYRKIRMRNSSGYPFTDVNNDIEDYFRLGYNLRLGAEIRLDKQFSLRGGYAFYQSPVANHIERNNNPIYTPSSAPQYFVEKDAHTASIGFGYRAGAFFFDMAFVEQFRTEHFYPYYNWDGAGEYANLKTNTANIVCSLGVKF
ncbi:MAG: outer membrane protein transport protein [Bacteroidales bacterium]|nr:outer membrane protein transport protein [Bacteroidales bacterium]